MNYLHIGTDGLMAWLLSKTKPDFLLIANGPTADAFARHFKTATVFDPTQHSFNPLDGMTYKHTREFAATVYGDKDLMTYRNGKRALTRMLLKAQKLDDLPDISHSGNDEAHETIDDFLLSPVLRDVLCRPTNFSFKGSVIARLDHPQLTEDDARALGVLLMGQHKGQIIVPDGGTHLRPLHLSLIRQNRLTVAVNYLAELEPKLRQAVLLIKDKQGSGCTHEDAVVLAKYAGLKPDPLREDSDYNKFIDEAMRGE